MRNATVGKGVSPINNNEHNWVIKLHREAIANSPVAPTANAEPPTVHHSDLPEANADSPLFHEWNTYRRGVAQLLTEGNEGRHVLIKQEKIIGIWDSDEEAMAVGYENYLGQPFLVHQIQERERIERCISVRACRSRILANAATGQSIDKSGGQFTFDF